VSPNPTGLASIVIRKRKLPCDTQEECNVMTEAEIGVVELYAKKYQRLMATIRSQEARRDSPLQVSGKHSPAVTLILDL
jgi:hypothetical protein